MLRAIEDDAQMPNYNQLNWRNQSKIDMEQSKVNKLK